LARPWAIPPGQKYKKGVQWGALGPGAKAPDSNSKTRWRTQKYDGGRFEDGGMAFDYVK